LTDNTSTRDFMLYVASKINKKAQDVEQYTAKLEENWFESVGSLKTLDDA